MRRYFDFWTQMIGLYRLNNIQNLFEMILADKIPGDLIETGSCKGGAVIFMRSLLKAYQIEDRVVWSCDTFSTPTPPGNVIIHNVVLAVVWLLASIPFLWWRRALLRFVMRVNPEFPADENPDDDEMYALVFLMKHAYLMKSRPGKYNIQKAKENVQSRIWKAL